MSRVRCNYCDQRGPTAERIRHSLGCPFRREMVECRECGGLGVHRPRCPYTAEVQHEKK
jgi:hypothetical protein